MKNFYLSIIISLLCVSVLSCSGTSGGRVVIAFDNSRIHSLNIEAKEFCSQAIRYSKEKKTGEAIKAYTRSIDIDPSAAAYNGRSVEYCHAGRYEDAVTDANKAILMSPKYPVPYVSRGNAYFKMNDYDRALKSYLRAIRLDPSNPGYYFNLGQAYYKKGLLDDALKSYNRTVELDPNHYAAWYNKACVCSLRKDPAGSLESLGKAIDAGFRDADRIKNEAALENVREMPEFKDLIQKIGNSVKRPQ